MKVACEGCGAKYAVPEDKIQGSNRTFKVTCRQCGAPIVIKGIASGSEAKWYFAVGRDRRGPVDDATIASHLSDGTLTPESLAWCQGMAGWEPVQTISGLAHLLEGDGGEQGEPEDISNDTTLVSRIGHCVGYVKVLFDRFHELLVEAVIRAVAISSCE